jgi:acyl CoA:acetate/3-ketoacid CoA transferase beta subunit
MAYIDVTAQGLILQEVAAGLTADEVQRATEPKLHIGAALKVMEG